MLKREVWSSKQMEKLKIKLRDRMVRHIDGPKAGWWLFLVSFAESSFFPIPPDLLLIPIVARLRSKWFYYALITTIASVIGGIFGYFIGAMLFDFVGTILVKTYHLEDELVYVSTLFQQNAFLAIFTAAFTPIPYKIFTIAGGLFHINFFVFVIASILGRGMRFFAVAYLMKIFGEQIGRLAFKYFNLLTLAVGIVIIGFIAYKFL